MTNTAKLSVSFSVAAAFLLAVGAASVLLIDHVNRILDKVGFDNLQTTQIADTITDLRLHPGRGRQDQARIDDLKRLARTNFETDHLTRARKSVESSSSSQAIAESFSNTHALFT